MQGNRVGDLPALDQLGGGGIDAAVLGEGEMPAFKIVGDHLVGAVVGEDGAEQGFLRLDVVGQAAELRRCAGLGAAAASEVFQA